MAKTPVWCRSISHQQPHAIIDGIALCNAKIDGWQSWMLLKHDEVDDSKRCSVCLARWPRVETTLDVRELGRKGGLIGGKARTRAKSRAARIRERNKRTTKPLCAIP